jgi:hypothetical protein
VDEKVMAMVGAAAAVTVAGRGMRPLAKMVMRGVVVANEVTTAGRRGLQDLYSEAKAERAGAAEPAPAPAPIPGATPGAPG